MSRSDRLPARVAEPAVPAPSLSRVSAVRGSDCYPPVLAANSPRVGRRQLAVLADELSERERKVLASVAAHRCLSARQIEAFHFQGNASPLTGARICRRVLARLVDAGLLLRLERRVGGMRAGSASFTYALAPAGARLLELPRQRREPTVTFLRHTLAVADLHLALLGAAREGRFELLKVEAEPECWRRYVGVGGGREIVRPDLYVLTASGEYECGWFLECDRSTAGLRALIGKCRQYDSYWRTWTEQERHGSFPLVAWVTTDDRRADVIRTAIARTRGLKRVLFQVITTDQLIDTVTEALR